MFFVRGEICSSRKSRRNCSRPDASVVPRNDVASLTFSGFVIAEILDPSVHLKNCGSRDADLASVSKTWNDGALRSRWLS